MHAVRENLSREQEETSDAVEDFVLVPEHKKYFIIIGYAVALMLSGLLMIVAIGGFALFGKNPYNILPILFGVFLFSRVQKEKFNKFILPAFFGTALGPMVSQVSFGYDFPVIQGIALAVFFGTLAGFVLPSLAAQFVKFHQGFNLYNIGFTATILVTVITSLKKEVV